MSELVNSFNLSRREIRVPEYRRGIKDPNTTQMAKWARKTHSHVSKSFVMSRLDFGQGVWKGDSYRQSALIPTYDALIQSYSNHTRKHVRSRSGTHGKISQHNSKSKISHTSIIIQARGLEGSNTNARS